MVLITGSNGLVGSHLLFYYAQKGIKVRALIREIAKKKNVRDTFSLYSLNPDELMNNIDWAIGDITDIGSLEIALNGVDKIYHTAAYVSFNRRNKNKVYETNIKGTANIVNLCIEKGIKKLCFVSSIAALGQNQNGEPVTEEILWKPSKNISAYSLSKYHSEMEIWRGITEGLNAVIVNPSVILGPGDWEKGSPALFNYATKGVKYYPSGSNGFVYVNDVVEGMVKAMDSEISGERFTLSSENISYLDFFTLISNNMGKCPPAKVASTFLLKTIYKIEWLRSFLFNCEPKITKDTVLIAQKKAAYSNQKSKEN